MKIKDIGKRSDMDFPMSKCLKLAGSNVKIRTYKSKVYYETNTKVYNDLGTSLDPPFGNP